MAAKYKHKVIIWNPSTATEVTLTTALDTQGTQGWELKTVMQNTTTRAFALFIKQISA
jgi:ABC-type Fe3+ transport system substrate-binding protein